MNGSGPMQWSAVHGFFPAGTAPPVSASEEGQLPGGATQGGFVQEQQAAPAPPPKLVAPAAPVKSKPLTPKNVVAMAKARLREVKSELRRMKALEKEKGELERLIAAAETPKQPNLREIKRPTG